MPKLTAPRTHTRQELAKAPAPVGIAILCIGLAVLAFSALSQLLN
jgi:xanthine/CO dehydrogenase XdhC/CoxF family maturation factor